MSTQPVNVSQSFTVPLVQGQSWINVTGLSLPWTPTYADASTASGPGGGVISASADLSTLSTGGVYVNLQGSPIDGNQVLKVTFYGYVAPPAPVPIDPWTMTYGAGYTNIGLIGGFISMSNLISLTDDTMSGNLNTRILNQVITAVSNMIDGMLSAIYIVPFNTSQPPTLVQSAATTIVCQRLMGRRLVPGESNPFDAEAKSFLTQLEQVARGIGGLDNATPRAFSPVIVEVSCSKLSGWCGQGSSL